MPTIAAGATNKNINIAPHGTGKVVVGTGAADATVQSDGDHNLVLKTGNSTTGKIEIVDGANGNIDITPNGTGEVDISKVDIDGGAVDGITLGTNSAVTEAQIDNINIDGNAITSTDTNGDIDLTPAGTGEVNISKVDIDGGAIDGTNVTVGSGKTLDVSAGSLTSSTAQKQAIVDGASIEGDEILATGESGTFLGADGDDSSSWQAIGGTLPSQTGNAEKILKTSGSAASWVATRKLIASTDGIQRSDATAVLSEDGSNVATLNNVTLGSAVRFPAGHIVNTQVFTHAVRFVPDDSSANPTLLEFTDTDNSRSAGATSLVKQYDASTSYLILIGTIPGKGANHSWSGCLTTVIGGDVAETTTTSAYGFLYIGGIYNILTGINFTQKILTLPAFTSGGKIYWGTSSASSSFAVINPNGPSDDAKLLYQTASTVVVHEVLI